MKPQIALILFFFSTSSAWAAKNSYELIIDPNNLTAAADQINKIIQQTPSLEKTADSRILSADIPTQALWAQILNHEGYSESAYSIWTQLLENPALPPETEEEIRLRLGETALRNGDWDEARFQFENVLKGRGARQMDAMIDLLITELGSGNPDAALHHAEGIKSWAHQPEDIPRSLFPLGMAAYQNKEFEEAVNTFKKIHGDPKARYFAGLAYRAMDQMPEAIAQWHQIKHDREKSMWQDLANFQLAETYFTMGDDALSRAICEKVLRNNGGGLFREKFIFRLASLEIRAGQYPKAIALLNEVLEDPQLSDRAVLLTAESMIVTGQSKELLKTLAKRRDKTSDIDKIYQHAWAALFDDHLEKALERSQPGLEDYYDKEITPRILLLQGVAFERMSDEAAALATFQMVTDRFPGTLSAGKATEWIIRAYTRMGRPKEAVTHGTHLWAQLDPKVRKEHPRTALWMGEANLNLGNWNEANKYYSQFINLTTPDDPYALNARFQQSVALAMLNRPQDALHALSLFEERSKILGYDTKDKSAWQRGNILFNQKQYQDAIASYREAKPSPNSLYYEGLALYRLEYYNDAVDTWIQLARDFRRNPLSEKGLFRAGRTQFELGESTDAVRTFAQFIKSYPNSPNVRDAYLHSAHALYNAGKWKDAANQYASFISLYPDHESRVAVAPFYAAALHQMGLTVDQLEKELRGLPPTDLVASLIWEKGASQYNAQNYDGAIQSFAKLLAIAPTSENALDAKFYRAESLYFSEKYREAEGALNAYLSNAENGKPENNALALFHKGISVYQQARILDAASLFEEFLIQHPQHELASTAKENMVMCHNALGDLPTANALSQKYESIGAPVAPFEPPMDMANQTGPEGETESSIPGAETITAHQTSEPALQEVVQAEQTLLNETEKIAQSANSPRVVELNQNRLEDRPISPEKTAQNNEVTQ